MKIKLATVELQRDSIVDGEGVRSVIWTQGCRHHCPLCHNLETHSFDKGFWVDIEDIKKKIASLEGQDGITFSGGDPMEQADVCASIAKYCHELGLNVWCYTGYTYEELLQKAELELSILEFLKQIDVLVDGKFEFQKKSYDVLFRGSTNQRLIDVPTSLSTGKIVEVNILKKSSDTIRGRKNQYMYL